MRRVCGIPQTLLIAGQTWRVVCSKRRPAWVKLEPGQHDGEVCGECNCAETAIWIRNSGNVEAMQTVLCHEIAHALLFEACRVSSDLQLAVGENQSLQERLADSLEAPLLALLRDNDLTWARVRRDVGALTR